MFKDNYSDIVMEHYNKVAKEDGDSPLSTMKDAYTRKTETDAILDIINFKTNKCSRRCMRIADVGCGNGYTLSKIKEKYPQYKCMGIEKNDALRKIAEERLKPLGVDVESGDILEPMLDMFGKFDVVISQRVIINVLDKVDQKKAMENIKELVDENGILILMECFESGLSNLNSAREEYGFSKINPSYHNLYLTEELVKEELPEFELVVDGLPPHNFLSTHYYITRVLHDLTLQGKPFSRNSHFVSFLSEAIPGDIGDYSPIKLYVYRKK